MKPYLVCDFDGCIIKEKADSIVPEVAAVLSELNQILSVVIVTARATDKSMNECSQMLKSSGLTHIPVYYRNMQEFDNSDKGLVRYKSNVIKRLNFTPIAAIGDNLTDDEAYFASGIKHIIRFTWNGSVATEPHTHVVGVINEQLLEAWEQVKTHIEGIVNK